MNAINAFNRLWFSIIFAYHILWTIECINDLKCNFNEFQSGCADRYGSQCDKKTQRCVCKQEFTIRLGHFCLQPKFMAEDCFTSAQCNHIPNAGCYNYREEFNHNPSNFFGTDQNMWPSGMCRCKIGHWFDTDHNTCVRRVVGSWCSNVWDCRHDDRGVVNTYVCENNECKCSPNHLYNQTTHECHYRETYGKVCTVRDECIHPTICHNKTCECASNYHFDNDKTPKCQPNNNLNDIKSAGSLDVAKGDKTFEIFILTVIPIVIIFLTLKPCLKKFGKCKPQTDEVICGSKEISIKCSDVDIEFPLNPHKFCEQLQTIEEVVEDMKVAKDDEIGAEVDANDMIEKKSIDNESPKDNRLNETTISMESSANS